MAELSGKDISPFLSWYYDNFISRWKKPFLRRYRHRMLADKFKSFGNGSNFSFECKFVGIEGISIGNRTSLANNTILDGRGGLEIGDNTMIGFQNIILTSTHNFSRLDIPMCEQGMYTKPVKIGSDVWTGCRVTILPGVSIGDHAIIAAGAVIAKDIPAWAVAGGVPAKIIRMRK